MGVLLLCIATPPALGWVCEELVQLLPLHMPVVQDVMAVVPAMMPNLMLVMSCGVVAWQYLATDHVYLGAHPSVIALVLLEVGFSTFPTFVGGAGPASQTPLNAMLWLPVVMLIGAVCLAMEPEGHPTANPTDKGAKRSSQSTALSSTSRGKPMGKGRSGGSDSTDNVGNRSSQSTALSRGKGRSRGSDSHKVSRRAKSVQTRAKANVV